MLLCTRCGISSEDGNAFCSNCGAPLPVAISDPQETNAQNLYQGSNIKVFLMKNGQQYGPYEQSAVEQWLQTGHCSSKDLGWYEGLNQWQPLGTLFPPETKKKLSKASELWRTTKGLGEEKFEEYIPKIKELLNKTGIKGREALENDELMTMGLSRVYDMLIISHPALRLFIKRDRFISIGLKNRTRLIDWHDTKSLPPMARKQLGETGTQNEEKEAAMPRDYIQEATSTIFGDKVPLAQLLETDPGQVVGNLLRALSYEEGMQSTMIRKGAAYALGQIGYETTMGELRERYKREQAPGVQEALVASMTAIRLAPVEAGHSQLERCQIIQDVYEGRQRADWN